MSIWIIGCGDIGRRVARLYQKDGTCTSGLVHSSYSRLQCEKIGIDSIMHDLDKATVLDASPFESAQLFYFAPPTPTGENDLRLKRFLGQLKGAPKKIVLISTTGVYGNSEGCWIDESFPVSPVADRAKRRLSAETILQKWAKAYQRDIVILRVPGIYALDRLPLQRLKKNLPLVNEGEAAWTNRIHADDLANVCKQAMNIKPNSIIYNVTDGSPSTMTDYFNQVADYAALARPPQISMQEAVNTLSKGMVSYLRESRRIRNKKMLEELEITLKYPSLRDCLQEND